MSIEKGTAIHPPAEVAEAALGGEFGADSEAEATESSPFEPGSKEDVESRGYTPYFESDAELAVLEAEVEAELVAEEGAYSQTVEVEGLSVDGQSIDELADAELSPEGDPGDEQREVGPIEQSVLDEG